MAAELTAHQLIAQHRPTLDQALEAIRTRAYWSPHPEHPKAYGENGSLGMAAGKAAFDALLGTRLDLGQPGTDDWVGGEVSPYGIELGVTYPHADVDVLLPAMRAGQRAWRDAGAEARAVVCLEILKRISDRTHEFAHAVMHTSGQAFMMAFQAGGPHAQDRGLEAVAYAYVEQVRTPDSAEWTKPQGKRDPLALRKTFTPVPRGIALLIGCNTFPTWNGYPGLFASLATGNAVLVKPHPRAVLPLALTVQVAREVLAEAGFDPNLVALAAERPGEGIAKTLAVRARDPDHRLHRLHGVRRLAGDQRPPGAGLHGEGRRQHGGRRLDRRLQGHAVQPGLLPVPLQRPDVHHPAEPADPPRRHHHGRGPQVVRRGGRRPRAVGRRAPRRRRPRERAAGRASSTRT